MKKIFISLLALALVTVVRAAIPPAENLLPDVTRMKSAAQESPQWQFWNDPAMKPFHDKFMAKFKETFAGALEQDLGVKLSDFENLPQGQLTLALTRNGWTGSDDTHQPGVLLLLDAGSQSALLKTNLAGVE